MGPVARKTPSDTAVAYASVSLVVLSSPHSPCLLSPPGVVGSSKPVNTTVVAGGKRKGMDRKGFGSACRKAHECVLV